MADDQRLETQEDGDEPDFMGEVRARWRSGYEREKENIDNGYEDVRFLVNDDNCQWPGPAKAIREAQQRPCMTYNLLPQFVRQVTGDIRQMRPSIKCVPVDDAADPKVAETIANMIRYIENRSKAPTVYARAADSQVAAGMGAWRVTTEYAGSTTFDQEIRIAPIDDALAVVWDPDASELSRADAMWCFVPVDLSKETFKARYPEASVDPFDFGPSFADWLSGEDIRVAEYWFKKPATKRLLKLDNAQIIDLTDMSDEEAMAEVEKRAAEGHTGTIEERESLQVWRAVISAKEELEPAAPWIGPDIPIVPVIGEEHRIGRKIVRNGAVRHAKDPQRSYNFHRTTQAEVIAFQPRAPWIGTEKMFKNDEHKWETANTTAHPFLTYTPDPNAPGLKPERIAPPAASAALHESVELAANDIKATIGIYDAGLGNRSNETSGKAIIARQREGDTGTFLYLDNFARAVQRTGEIIVNLIPRVYDSARTIRILGEDGKMTPVAINKPAGVALDGKAVIENDLTVGQYDVVMEMGPSYTTRREEAREGMLELMRVNPALAPIIGDLIAKDMDWPNAREIGKRLERLLPAPIQAMIAQDRDEQPAPPPPPNPAQQAAMAAEQRQQQLDAGKQQLEAGKLQVDREKTAVEAERVRTDARANELDAAARVHEARLQAAAQQPAPDPRVDQLIGVVADMQKSLMQLVAAQQAPAVIAPAAMPDRPPGPFGPM